MDAEEKTRRVHGAAYERGGRRCLSCAAAFTLARECGMTVKEIGEICNRDGIKIVACQLGCFS